MRGRRALSIAVVTLLLAACADSAEEPSQADETSRPDRSAPAFSAQVQELCEPVARRYRRLRDAGSRRFEQAAARLARAERKVAAGLAQVEAPSGVEDDVASYADALEAYSDAQMTAMEVSGSGAKSYDDVVHAAKSGVHLFEAKERLGLPETCPPFDDVFMTLFVARANRECYGIRKGIDTAALPRRPDSPAEAIELLAAAVDATAEFARALRRAAPERGSLRIGEIVTLGKHRLRTLHALRRAVSAGDAAGVDEASAEVARTGRRLGREMSRVGLVGCINLFAALRV